MPWEGAEQPMERREASSAVWEGDADQKRRYQWQQARRSYHKTAKARPQEGEAEGRDQQKFQGEENSAEDFQAEQSIEGHMVTEPPGPLAWGRNSSEARADWWSSSST